MENNTQKINWYPGHMEKTKRLIKENIKVIDIIYEVLDSRIPYSSRIKDIDEIIKNKSRIIIMTKYDLCDKVETNKFIKLYEEQGYKVLKINLLKDKIDGIIESTNLMLEENYKKRLEKGIIRKKHRVLIIGVPNVGKSTLINRLVGKKATEVGNRPGVTKGLTWIRINDQLELLDSPGLLWPKLEDREGALNLSAVSSIKETNIPIEEVAIHIINKLKEYYPNKLFELYKTNKNDIFEILNEIGNKRGYLFKNKEVDYNKVYTLILKDIRDGKIKNITFDRM